jgi:hypothetical protein
MRSLKRLGSLLGVIVLLQALMVMSPGPAHAEDTLPCNPDAVSGMCITPHDDLVVPQGGAGSWIACYNPALYPRGGHIYPSVDGLYWLTLGSIEGPADPVAGQHIPPGCALLYVVLHGDAPIGVHHMGASAPLQGCTGSCTFSSVSGTFSIVGASPTQNVKVHTEDFTAQVAVCGLGGSCMYTYEQCNASVGTSGVSRTCGYITTTQSPDALPTITYSSGAPVVNPPY